MTNLSIQPSGSRAMRGALYMVGAGLCFAFVNTAVQFATMVAGMASPSAAFWQYLIAAVLFLPMVLRAGRGAFQTPVLGLHILRVVLSAIGVMLWTAGLAHVPIWQAIALILLSPVFVTLGAAVILQENVTPIRWIAVLVGVLGGVIILAPWSERFTVAALYPVGAAVFWAAVSLLTKRMTEVVSAETLTLYLLVFLTPVNAVFAVGSGFAIPQAAIWAVIGAGALTAAAQYLIARAYAVADAAYLQPFDHLKLPLNVALGWMVFGFHPEGVMWLGTALILLASIVLLQAEAKGH